MSENLQDIIINQEDIECAICMETSREKDQKQLLCNHIFCIECLLALGDQKSIIECYICKVKTKIPHGGLKDLPKSPRNNFSKENKNNKNENCRKHDKQFILIPKIYCKTCKVFNLCQECLKDDHTNEKCEILLIKSINDYKFEINKCEKDEKLLMEKLIQDVDILEEEYIEKIKEKCSNLKRKIKQNYERKIKEYENLKSKIELENADEGKFNGQLQELTKFQYKIEDQSNNILNFNLTSNILLYKDDEIQLKKLNLIHKLPIKNTFLQLGDDGYYYTKTAKIGFIGFQDLKVQIEISIQEFNDRHMTENYLFCISKKDRRLYYSSKGSFNEFQCLKVDGCYLEYKAIWAVGEDFLNGFYIIAENINGNFDYFVNNNYIRSIPGDGILKICFFIKGHIVIYRNNELLLIDKDTDDIIQKTEMHGFSNMCYFPNYGLLILLKTDQLILYDHNFIGRQNLFCYPYVLGVTRSGLICTPKSLPVKEILIYKFE